MAHNRKGDLRKFVLNLPENLTVNALAFSEKGQLLAVVARAPFAPEGPDKNKSPVQVWDVERGAVLWQWQGKLAETGSMAIYPDGPTIAQSSDKSLVVWNALTGQELWHVTPHAVANAIAFSPDGKLIATAGPYGLRDGLAFIDLWDASNGKNLFSCSPGIASCDALAFSHDGTKIAVGGIHEDSGIGSLYIFATNGRKLLDHEIEAGGMGSIAFSRDMAVIATGVGGEVILWDARKGTKIREFARKAEEPFVAALFTRATPFFHPDGKTLIINLDLGDNPVPDFDLDRVVASVQKEGRKGFQRGIDELISKMPSKHEKKVSEVQFWDYQRGKKLGQYIVEHDWSNIGPGFETSICALSADGDRFACCRHNTIHIVQRK